MRSPSPVASDDPERTRVEVEEDLPATSHSTDGLARGSVLAGKYRLEMLLGQGGMACVWSAYHLELELPVAIKLLRTGFKNDILAARLRLEARAEAHLAHPSIVRVFDVSVTESGDPFIVMELLAGESLAARIAREPLSGVQAVQLLLPIADALAVAHAKGIVHRDLKPHNVFLAKDARDVQPKLLDFGIAKLEHAVGRKLTDKGMVLGSPNYMSPEQVRGDDVDYRTDIWSFSVVLYKALTGKLPFVGDTRVALHSILHDEPAPLPASVDAELGRLILWGLAKDPQRRPRGMRELGFRLAQWLERQGTAEDACGAPLRAKWLPPTAKPLAKHAVTVTVASAPTLRAARNIKRHYRWALLTAGAVSLVSGSLAWADSAPGAGAPPPASWVAAPAVPHLQTPSNQPVPAADVNSDVNSDVNPNPADQVTPAVLSPVAPSPPAPPPAANPPAKRSAKAVRPPTSQLPF